MRIKSTFGDNNCLLDFNSYFVVSPLLLVVGLEDPNELAPDCLLVPLGGRVFRSSRMLLLLLSLVELIVYTNLALVQGIPPTHQKSVAESKAWAYFMAISAPGEAMGHERRLLERGAARCHRLCAASRQQAGSLGCRSRLARSTTPRSWSEVSWSRTSARYHHQRSPS